MPLSARASAPAAGAGYRGRRQGRAEPRGGHSHRLRVGCSALARVWGVTCKGGAHFCDFSEQDTWTSGAH